MDIFEWNENPTLCNTIYGGFCSFRSESISECPDGVNNVTKYDPERFEYNDSTYKWEFDGA